MPGIPTPRPQTEDDNADQTPLTVRTPTRGGDEGTTQGQESRNRQKSAKVVTMSLEETP